MRKLTEQDIHDTIENVTNEIVGIRYRLTQPPQKSDPKDALNEARACLRKYAAQLDELELKLIEEDEQDNG